MLVREGYVQHHTDWSFCFASHSAGNIYVVKRKVKEHSFRCSWLILVVRSQFLFSPLLHCMWGKHEWLSLYPLSTADLKKIWQEEKDLILIFCNISMYYCQTPSGILAVVVFVIAGPNEAQGHTRNLLINSLSDNMLFTADGDQAVIGPDKLRITGMLTSATCHRCSHFLQLSAGIFLKYTCI